MIIILASVSLGQGADEVDKYISSIAQGDDNALAELYRATGKIVYAYAFSILRNTYDAEDVLHDTYLSVCRSAVNYTSKGKPLAWIFTITRNLCLKKLQENNKVADIPDEDIAAFIPSKDELSVEDKLVLGECMKKLDSTERQIVLLHAVCGFKHREIAELLKLYLPTVISKYNRALKKLRSVLEESEGIDKNEKQRNRE